jgi:hypothetical protein
MARFHFHLQTPEPEPDDAGSEHAGLDAAKRHALTLLAQTLAGHPDQFWEAGVCRVTVTDETDVALFTLTVEAVLPTALTSLARKLST